MTVHTHPTAIASAIEPGIAAHLDTFVALRRDFHRYPELAFREARTSAKVAELLTSWGYEVTTGIAGTGVVGTLRHGAGGKAIGLRADMDALPIHEETGLPYASETTGVMHACGHDGHITILLAAARHLAETRNFDGTLHLIFQPAEEIGAGARRMLAEGLFERFPVDAVFGLHNWPGVPTGYFGFVAGAAMASVDKALIKVVGKGGHGAAPHETVDPILVAAHLITALQSVVSRNVDPRQMAIVTVGSIHGGTAANVIPESVDLQLTIRSFDPAVRQLLQRRIPDLVEAQAAAFGAMAEVDYRLGLPSVANHVAETEFAAAVALDTFGRNQVDPAFPPRTASEDFAYFLEAKRGSSLFVGNGQSASLHNGAYDFNDALIAPAATFWTRLTERFLS
ncbi:hippurate hydrolase [Bosea sp. BE125]|uniref:M20 aminoacylase family protein n=1 Tax=Bosea sp. BE125 TaxID=2817909 RepID=UPI002864CC9A|nr:M20 aminoacylase family protein [Bosea sp. BE125]MDR6871731.1 hippurate hydrolase [Bosea sp. BE125]